MYLQLYDQNISPYTVLLCIMHRNNSLQNTRILLITQPNAISQFMYQFRGIFCYSNEMLDEDNNL